MQATSHLAFYQTAATVIPVLFIAVVVTLRRFEREDANPVDIGFGLAAIIAAAVGEFTALFVLSGAEVTPGREQVVGYAIFLLGLELVVSTTVPLYQRLYRTGPRPFFWTVLVATIASISWAWATYLQAVF